MYKSLISYFCVCLLMFVCPRRQVEGQDRCLRKSLWRGSGLYGGSGQNALKPAAWASHRGAESVYPLHLPKPLTSPSPRRTGQVICPGASGVLLSHLWTLTTLLATLGNTHLIVLHRSPATITQDSLCIGIRPLEEKGFQSQDKPIARRLFTIQNSPQPIRTLFLLTELPTTHLHMATTSQHGSSGGRPIQEQWEAEEVGADAQSPPVGRVRFQGGEWHRRIGKQTNLTHHQRPDWKATFLWCLLNV